MLLWLTAAASLALGAFAYLDMHPGSPLFSSSRGSELGRSLLLVALGLLVVLGIWIYWSASGAGPSCWRWS